MISITRTVSPIILAVAPISGAAMATIVTAVAACSRADANDSTTPRRQVSSLASR
jgi:hypothetical protein